MDAYDKLATLAEETEDLMDEFSDKSEDERHLAMMKGTVRLAKSIEANKRKADVLEDKLARAGELDRDAEELVEQIDKTYRKVLWALRTDPMDAFGTYKRRRR